MFKEEFKDQLALVQILLVVHDCFKQSEENAIRAEKKSYGFVKTIILEKKVTKATAIKEGFKHCTADYVCFADIDRAVPPSEIYKLFKNIGKYDCIIGSRNLPESKIFIKQSLQRRIAGKVFNLICRFTLGIPYKDTQCSGKIFKKESIKNVINQLDENASIFDIGLIYHLFLQGYSIKEFPINWYHDDNSKIRIMSHGPSMLSDLFKLKFKTRTKKRNYKNILFLQHHYIGQGTFIRSINLAKHMADKDLHIKVTGVNNQIKFLPEYETLDDNPHITLVKLPRFFKNNSPLDLLLRIPFASWIVLKNHYDILYAFALGMPTNSIPALLYKIFKGNNIIVDWDDLWHDGYGKFTGKIGNLLFYLFEVITLKLIKPQHATTVSGFLKEKFTSNGMNQTHVYVIGNGVGQDEDININFNTKTKLRSIYNISPETKILISVGNTYGKSFENLIDAFKISSSQNENLRLFLLGSFMKGGQLGKYVDEIIKNNRELFLSKIKILGLIPYQNYLDYLILADMAILPMEDTNIDKARFPIRLGDYIRYNLPIVSNATGVVEDILKKYNYGLISDVNDIDQFGNNILECAAHIERYASREKAYSILKNELDWSVHSMALRDVFDKVFSDKILPDT